MTRRVSGPSVRPPGLPPDLGFRLIGFRQIRFGLPELDAAVSATPITAEHAGAPAPGAPPCLVFEAPFDLGCRPNSGSWPRAGCSSARPRGNIRLVRPALRSGPLHVSRPVRPGTVRTRLPAEYAEVFPTVCVDAAYYTFPTEAHLAPLAEAADFRFAFKVTDAITLRRFPNLPRFGAQAGRANPDFLNAARFCEEFLGPLAVLGSRVGPLIFEFSRFYPADYSHGREFVADLDRFWGNSRRAGAMGSRSGTPPSCTRPTSPASPAAAWPTCTTHGPPCPPSRRNSASPAVRTAAFTVARFLLREGREYAEAVKRFSPYRETRDVNEAARGAGTADRRRSRRRPRATDLQLREQPARRQRAPHRGGDD